MEIREYKPEDFEELAKLKLELAKSLVDWIGLNPEMVTIENTKEVIKKELADKSSKCFLCETKENIVGYISGKVKTNGEEFQVRTFLDIEDVYVLPEFRKKGIGKELIKKMESYAKQEGITNVVLRVSDKNKKVLDFYKKQDYIILEYVLDKELK